LRARELLQIERVHRLPDLEIHVVGDVDDAADGPDAGGEQTVGHPLGSRPDLYVAGCGRVPGTESGILDGDLQTIGGTDRNGRQAMVAPRSVEGSVSGRSYAVDTSRARPRTLRQSGRLAVTSKSITASP